MTYSFTCFHHQIWIYEFLLYIGKCLLKEIQDLSWRQTQKPFFKRIAVCFGEHEIEQIAFRSASTLSTTDLSFFRCSSIVFCNTFFTFFSSSIWRMKATPMKCLSKRNPTQLSFILDDLLLLLVCWYDHIIAFQTQCILWEEQIWMKDGNTRSFLTQ